MKNQFQHPKTLYSSFMLPAGFRTLGYFLIAIAGFILILFESDNSFHYQESVYLTAGNFKTIFSLLLVAAFLFISLAKDIKEDEFTGLIKLKAIRDSFIASVLYIFFLAIIYSFAGKAALPEPGVEPLLGILAVYHISVFVQKQSVS